ncbi:uncharacterized protein I206_105125 [Kwoniella pini CBS 10737]|uniref:Uncharacterized protein n=1 Tax=Kwoniella pini CBS 10737 TaxID=1296096 RepID=A0A1B9I8V7_9TREE|nr:uncharacterized protein I206_02667 [Kwoniella pini CBS 10737]OCF51950.1 hypothetical protein I206_02667 [Kwoniella pini CBS 10737]
MIDTPKTDIILSMAHTSTEDYMQQIVNKSKTHEFRKKLYPSSVVRIWFYETFPISAITYICEINPAHIRDKNGLLDTIGIGNKEFNEPHKDWLGYEYAYKVISCYKSNRPITLNEMKSKYGINGAPRGMVYVKQKMMEDVKWDEQECIWRD